MRHKAVLFDLDGTLLDTLEDLADSMNTVLESNNYPTHDVGKYKHFVGDGVVELVKRTLPPNMVDQRTVDRCVQSMKREYSRRWICKTRLYGGVSDLLDALISKRIKLAILSNKPHLLTEKMVRKYLDAWQFEAVLGARDGVPLKPDTTSALSIAGALSLSPQEFLYLGDTNTDMQTACNAGMHAVGVLWGFRERDELKRSGACDLIAHPLDLLTVLQ